MTRYKCLKRNDGRPTMAPKTAPTPPAEQAQNRNTAAAAPLWWMQAALWSSTEPMWSLAERWRWSSQTPWRESNSPLPTLNHKQPAPAQPPTPRAKPSPDPPCRVHTTNATTIHKVPPPPPRSPSIAQERAFHRVRWIGTFRSARLSTDSDGPQPQRPCRHLSDISSQIEPVAS